MDALLDQLFKNKLLYAAASAIATLLLRFLISEFLRLKRLKWLIIEPADMPMFKVNVEGSSLRIQMVGDYMIVNLSELPVTFRAGRPHLLVFNLASRAFQFKVMPGIEFDLSNPGVIFKDLPVAARQELVLIEGKTCSTHMERYWCRRMPRFLWIETLEVVRIASKTKWVHRCYLYRRRYESGNEVWFKYTGTHVSSGFARLLALPGKLLHSIRNKVKNKFKG